MMPIDHDGLYKAVINEFFLDFMRLFYPDVAEDIDPTSVKEKEQELLADWEDGSTLRVDIVREVKLEGEKNLVLILIEPQSYNDKEFGKRLFRYFTRLYDKYELPIIPIAVLSYPSPKAIAPQTFTIVTKRFTTIIFNYETVQLNRLRWKNYAERGNPVAAAFMSQMQVSEKQRVQAKLAALNQVADLDLNESQRRLLSGFVDTYLPLDTKQQAEFDQELDKLGQGQKEKTMEITTSWERKGAYNLAQKLLTRRFGPLSQEEERRMKELDARQLETLGEAFLDFKEKSDFIAWLDTHTATSITQ